MTANPKVVQLVVDKGAKQNASQEIAVSISANVKYIDNEVVLVKTSVGFCGQESSSHIIVETPKK